MYRSGLLLGRDHTELGEYEVVEVAPNLAIGLSRGRFHKGYPSSEANEDAVFAATDGQTVVMAVADGHHGTDASHDAIATISAVARSHIAERPLAGFLMGELLDQSAPSDGGDTALALFVGNHSTVHACQFGDTSLIRAKNRTSEVIEGKSGFLGSGTRPDILAMDSGSARMWCLVSDGVSDFVRLRSKALQVTDGSESPSQYARRLIEEAFRGGAGDNIAVAAYSTSD